MKIKEGFVLRRVLDEAVVVASGEASKSFNGMIKLNDTAADIWEAIASGKNIDEIAKVLTEKYDIPLEKATEDTKALVDGMMAQGFIEE